jgi:hypothetical protein
MSELTDLEIRKRVTEIELNATFINAKSIEYDELQRCYWVETAGFSSYPLLNPLTDDALCFQLMVKYECGVINVAKGVFVTQCKMAHSEANHNTTVNKAICLAIIEANKKAATK